MTDIDHRPAADTTEDFAARMVSAIDGASLALLMSIGHQTSLWDVMSGAPPATSAQIAASVGLNERYVREWLGGVVAAEVVEYDPEAGTYALPPYRAAVLTRAAGPDNLARVAQFIPLLAEVRAEDRRLLPQRRWGALQRVSAVPRAHGRGQRRRCSTRRSSTASCRWSTACRSDCARVADVADIGCGSGHAINVMARAFPTSRFTGIDFSAEGLGVGRAEASRSACPTPRSSLAT